MELPPRKEATHTGHFAFELPVRLLLVPRRTRIHCIYRTSVLQKQQVGLKGPDKAGCIACWFDSPSCRRQLPVQSYDTCLLWLAQDSAVQRCKWRPALLSKEVGSNPTNRANRSSSNCCSGLLLQRELKAAVPPSPWPGAEQEGGAGICVYGPLALSLSSCLLA